MSQFQDKKNYLLDSFLECEVERIGLKNVLFNLVYSWHFTRNELIELGFETIDIDEAIEESKKYD